MADLLTNINQAISDFNSIKTAIINKGVDIPADTHTSEYAQKINNIETNTLTPSDEGIFKKLFKYGLDYLCQDNLVQILTEAVDVLSFTKSQVYLLKPTNNDTKFINLPEDISHEGVLINYYHAGKYRCCIYYPSNEDIILRHTWGNNNDPVIQWQYLKLSNFNNGLNYNPEIIKNVIKYSFMKEKIRNIVQPSENWNDITGTGWYMMNPSSNANGLAMPNFPGSDIFRWGTIVVLNLGSVIFQIYYAQCYNQATNTFTYRECRDGVWGEWLRIAGSWTK